MKRSVWNGIPVTTITSNDGAAAVIADYGAHILKWTTAEGEEGLFLSESSSPATGQAIRGGVPIVFPQFAERGDGMRHGFARLAQWHMVSLKNEDGWTVAEFALDQESIPDKHWQHSFSLRYQCKIRSNQLCLSLQVENLSEHAWEFSAALHTYLEVSDIAYIQLEGLENVVFVDQTQKGLKKIQTNRLSFAGEVDRIYIDTPQRLQLHDKNRKFTIAQHGFRDTVIWNPGREKAAMLADLDTGRENEFLCVEAAQVMQPVLLKSRSSWTGSQIFSLMKN